MVSTLGNFFDLLIPKEGGFSSNPSSFIDSKSLDLKNIEFAGGRLYYLFNYDFELKNLFIKLKKGGEYSVADEMGELLAVRLKKEFKDRKIDLVLFAPSDPKRLLERGFNVPKIFTQKTINKLSTTSLDVFKKSKTSKNTSKLNLKNRSEYFSDTFLVLDSYIKEKLTKARSILIVDDISTTGATLLDLRNTLAEKFDLSDKIVNYAVIAKTQKNSKL